MKTLKSLFLLFHLLSFFQVSFGQELGAVQYELKDTVLARELLEEGVLSIKKFDFEKSISILQEAKTILAQLGENKNEIYVEILLSLGVSHLQKKEFDLAETYWKSALDIQKANFPESHILFAKTYNNLGTLSSSKFNFDKAVNYHQKALAIQKKSLSKNHIDIGKTYYNLGNTYQSIAVIDTAIESYQNALEIFASNENVNKMYLVFTYNNLGNTLNLKGEYKSALISFQNSLDIALQIFGPNHPQIVNPYNNLGATYQYLGEFEKANKYYSKGLKIRLSTLGEEHVENAQSYNNIANTLIGEENYARALFYYRKAAALQIDNLGLAHPDLALTLNNMGNTEQELGEYESAIANHNKAKEIWSNALGKEHIQVARAYTSLGNLYYLKKDFEESLRNHFVAESILENNSDPNLSELANCYLNLSRTYREMGERFKAHEYLEKSFEALNYKEDNDFTEARSLGNLMESLYEKAKYHNEIFQEKNELYQLQKAASYLDQLVNASLFRFKSQSSVYHSSLIQPSYNFFEDAILSNLKLYDNSNSSAFRIKSFLYNERSKSFLLYQSIQESDALQYAGIPDSLLDKEYDLRIDITYFDKKRQEKLSEGLEETDTTILAISSKLFDLNREYEALKDRFEKEYPDYYNLKYELSTVTLEYVQDTLLAAEQTLLEYFVGDSSIFIFTVGHDQYEVVEVKKDFPLNSLVQQFQNGLYGYYGKKEDKRSDALYRKSIKDYTTAAPILYEKLIAPVKDQLKGEVIVVPDGVLGYVPFEALLTEQPKRVSAFDSYPFLLHEHRFSYCYSATLLKEMKEKKHKQEPTKELVAFAPFYEGSYAQLDSTFALTFDTLASGQDTMLFENVVTRKDFTQLPNSGEEVVAACKLWNGDYFLNSDATEDRFNTVAGDYRIVHLSTHGIADSRVGDYSYLAFAEQKDSLENEYLYVRDLYNTQLNADLIVLSACETATGELQRGEGIISLARAFAYAGAKSILTTLWVVDDAATKDLTKSFYVYLRQGKMKDEALHLAKLNHIKNNENARKHPFFWAAMIGVGDMSALR